MHWNPCGLLTRLVHKTSLGTIYTDLRTRPNFLRVDIYNHLVFVQSGTTVVNLKLMKLSNTPLIQANWSSRQTASCPRRSDGDYTLALSYPSCIDIGSIRPWPRPPSRGAAEGLVGAKACQIWQMPLHDFRFLLRLLFRCSCRRYCHRRSSCPDPSKAPRSRERANAFRT